MVHSGVQSGTQHRTCSWGKSDRGYFWRLLEEVGQSHSESVVYQNLMVEERGRGLECLEGVEVAVDACGEVDCVEVAGPGVAEVVAEVVVGAGGEEEERERSSHTDDAHTRTEASEQGIHTQEVGTAVAAGVGAGTS